MSREQYQAPSGGGAAGGQSFGGGDAGSGGRSFAPVSTVMYYTCGDCALRVPLEKGAPIRCQMCGGRVLYKERTKR